MAYFDEEKRESEQAPQENIAPAAEPAEKSATDLTVSPVEENAGTAENGEDPAQEAEGKPEEAVTDRPGVSYTPDNQYNPQAYHNPHGSSYAPPRTAMGYKTAEEVHPRRGGNARTVILCSILAVALLFGSFFGGAALGRTLNFDDLPGQSDGPGGDTPDPGTEDPGPGDAEEKPGRGDVVLNVIERDAAEYAENSIPTVVKNVADSVVEIRTETTTTSAFYGDYVESGAGSGVILSEDGLILTCDHVIAGAGSITVVLNNGQQYTAEVYGEDSWSDLALLKINATGLTPAVVAKTAVDAGGDYAAYLTVGEGVVAIGNPLGELGGSVSNGIISALGRNVTVEGVPMTLLQTNAAVNPGNSGGGLFNMYGELIGIVNAKSTGDSVEGIGFAIPISDAVTVYKQLYDQGYVSGRPHLGLYFEASSSGLKIISYDYNDELTGGETIQNGDMLYSADGTVITSIATLRTVLAGKKVGDTVNIQVERYVRQGYGYYRVPLEFTITVHEYVPATNP